MNIYEDQESTEEWGGEIFPKHSVQNTMTTRKNPEKPAAIYEL